MKKSPDAFRTISEVAAWLETPAHVLRFWESRFPELKPVQRAGGRRYYRPQDMLLLGGIKHLLHTEGHTIKSVQDRIKADGTDAVAAFSPPLEVAAPATADASGDGADAVTAAPEADTALAEGLVAAPAAAPETPPVTSDDSTPPIGFFFDDSEDAAPADAQSGTFAQAHPNPGPDAPAASDAPPPDPAPAAQDAMPDPTPAAARLGPLPDLPDDPADDAPGYGVPLPLPARLRALLPDDVPAAQRDTLRGLFRRLDGMQHARA